MAQLYRPQPAQAAPARPGPSTAPTARTTPAPAQAPQAPQATQALATGGRIDPRASQRGRIAPGVNNRSIQVCSAGACSTHKSNLIAVVDDILDSRPIPVGPSINRATSVSVKTDGPWLICATMDPLRYGQMKVETEFCRLVDGAGEVRFPVAPMELIGRPLLPGPRYDARPLAVVNAGARCGNCQAERAEMRRVGKQALASSELLMTKAQAICRTFGYGPPLTIDTADLDEGVVTLGVACEA